MSVDTVNNHADDLVTWRIRDVARMTNISERRILDACRAGQLDHVHAYGRRSMTHEQIRAMIQHFSTRATQSAAAPVVDPREQVRQSSLKAAARRSPRRLA